MLKQTLFLEKGLERIHPPYPPKEIGEVQGYSDRIGCRITHLTPAFCNASQSNLLQVLQFGATCYFRICLGFLVHPLEHIACSGSEEVVQFRAKKKPSVQDDGCMMMWGFLSPSITLYRRLCFSSCTDSIT